MNWQRARSDDQIEQREAAILEAAATLFEEFRFDEITFVMIGKKANFTRSNLYRYFKTKEEVFLRLLTLDMIEWQISGTQLIEQSELNSKNFIALWLPLVAENQRLLRLYEILASVLEMNVSEEALKRFKIQSHDSMSLLIDSLIEKNLFDDNENAFRFLISHIALVSGMNPKLRMPSSHHKVLKELNMAPVEGYYESILAEGVNALYERYAHKK
jgi:AcrR family transcriptional regulator